MVAHNPLTTYIFKSHRCLKEGLRKTLTLYAKEKSI